MKTLVLKGNNQKIIVNDNIGQIVIDAHKSGKNEYITVPKFSGFTNDVRYILDGVDQDGIAEWNEKQKDERKAKNDGYYQTIEDEWQAELMRLKNGDKKHKLNTNFKVANLVCYAQTGEWLEGWKLKNETRYKNLTDFISQLLETQVIVSPEKYKHFFGFADEKTTSTILARQASLLYVDKLLFELKKNRLF